MCLVALGVGVWLKLRVCACAYASVCASAGAAARAGAFVCTCRNVSVRVRALVHMRVRVHSREAASHILDVGCLYGWCDGCLARVFRVGLCCSNSSPVSTGDAVHRVRVIKGIGYVW